MVAAPELPPVAAEATQVAEENVALNEVTLAAQFVAAPKHPPAVAEATRTAAVNFALYEPVLAAQMIAAPELPPVAAEATQVAEEIVARNVLTLAGQFVADPKHPPAVAEATRAAAESIAFNVHLVSKQNEMGSCKLNSCGLPLRPGLLACDHYLRKGWCSRYASCWFDHPDQDWEQPAVSTQKSTSCAQPAAGKNIYGFPLRPGQAPCEHYLKTWKCKRGASCLLSHPEYPEQEDGRPAEVRMSDLYKAELVDIIKALQRSDPDYKQAWCAFCDAQAKGVKDPNRHEVEALEQFLTST
jgi:hypothetical protein